MSQPTIPPFPVEELAKAVVAQITAHGGPPPTVTVTRPQEPATKDADSSGDVAGSPVSGLIVIEIVYNGSTYTLYVQSPTDTLAAWLFQLTYQAKGADKITALALYEYAPDGSWRVGVETPSFSRGKLTIERISVELKSGSPPSLNKVPVDPPEPTKPRTPPNQTLPGPPKSGST